MSCAGEVEYNVSVSVPDELSVGWSVAAASGSSVSRHSPDDGQRGAVRIGFLFAVTIVVSSSYISAPFCRSTVVYPASAILGMLINDECMPGTMFISRAPSRSLCRSIIFLVAGAVRRSGNMKIFIDFSPVSSSSSASSSGPAPEVAPESNTPVLLVFLFAIFRAQCAATLLRGLMSV